MLIAQFGLALALLTRLPAGALLRGRVPALAQSVWAFPLVGVLIGAIGAAAFGLARAAGLPPLLSACWTVAALVLLTGGLHEDGLADFADGCGGGHTRERKLEIMRDSRIGSYGALALVLAVAIRVTALAALPRAWPALIAAGALSRAAMAGPLRLPPARKDGLGVAMAGAAGPGLVAVALGVVIAFLVLSPARATVALLAASLASGLVAALARAQLGGFTGDVLGASAIVSEAAVLTVLASP